ncbi:MAG: metallophosphoesterase [Clostridia bacterium]|nr:metallophosphoesterase [Clostridia bacterium]
MKLLPFADYAKKETLRVKGELPKKGAHDLRFAFITDLHYKFNEEMQASVSNTIHAINTLNKEEKIDFLCLGGDNVGNYPASPEEHVEMMRELASFLAQCDVPVICVQGNHDDNSIHGRISPYSCICRTGANVPDDVQYDVLFADSEKCEHYHGGGNKALYGYFDAPAANTRVVFLNSSGVPYIVENGIMIYNQQWDFGYTEAQLSWLCNTALKDAPENVIFIQHRPFARKHEETNETIYNADVLDKITQAFVRGAKAQFINAHEDFGYSIFADFGGKAHRVPVRIAGHCHADRACVDDMGLLSVTTMLAGRNNSGLAVGDDGEKYSHEPFSATETSFDIFTFSPEHNTLVATRYGAGKSRKFDI